MRFPTTLSALVLAATGLVAQSNTVTGLDGRLTVIDNMTYYGRQGGSHPNGEIGMAMLNTMCNPGSVNIPWFQAMQPDHPMFGFLVVRVHDDKIEQINDYRSYCKHAFLSINVNGSCGSCQNPGTGSLMGINCSDTYAPGNNASRTWLGPAWEIDPWLGTWDPVGSYFDIGHPNQAGYPLPADGSRSLNYNFNSVENRVTIAEQDMLVAGASYFYGLQLIHEGEALANRADNLAHRGFNPTWNGSSWSFPNNGAAQQYGSILDRWTGATVESASNGLDDGRFYVASKVTGLGGGNYHYEYAVHNVDNSRGGSVFRVPLPAGVTATNFTFGDIDSNAGNDWTAQQVGSEVVFSSNGQNFQDWNMIFNFGFDADMAPGQGGCRIDAARPGPGASDVTVPTEVPGGLILADFTTFGAGCDGSVSGGTVPCLTLNPNGGSLTNSTNQYEYSFRVTNSGTTQVTGFEIFTGSNAGSISRAAHIYLPSGSLPATSPLATTTITVDSAAGFYAATFNPPVSVTGDFYIGYENSPGGYISNLSTGAAGLGFYRNAGSGSWLQSGLVDNPSWRVYCVAGTNTFLAPELANGGLPQLGSTYDVTLADAMPVTFAIALAGLSDQAYTGLPLPLALPGAPGCELLVSADDLRLEITDGSGASSTTYAIPSDQSLVGQSLFHQWAVWDPSVNGLGIVMSNAGNALIGN